MPLAVRNLRRADVAQIARLYYETVHRVNARDYGPEQIRAWAPRVYPEAWWQRRFKDYEVLVAADDGLVVGFAELAPDGHLDCFYVHHSRQGVGVGRMLMERVFARGRTLGTRRLRADVSITAEPFFRRMGFRTLRRQTKVYRNRAFRQFLMERPLKDA
jgi:putative acetyltransferase